MNLEEKQKLIHTEISKFTDEANDRFPIYDGAIKPESYLNSSTKIVWLLKEAYDGVNGTGGGWTYQDMLGKDDVYDTFVKNVSVQTWHPIVYVSYGILNGFLNWNQMDYIRDLPEMALVLHQIGIINALKLPAPGVTKTSHNQLVTEFPKYKDINLKQLELLNPDIVIAGSVFYLYKEAWGLTDEDCVNQGSIHSYEKDGRLYINAYHPAQRTVSGEVYINDIVNAVKEWRER